MNAPQIVDWRSLNRQQQVMLYVLCELQQLKELGLISGGHVKPGPLAMAAFEEMKSESFEISKEETNQAIAGMEEHYKSTLAALAAAVSP
jgi:hypothetical protein